MRYFLIGFMGSGKSYMGNILSKKMKIKHLDLDKYIERMEKKTIPEIFKSHGESHYRKIEKKYLQEIIHKEKNVIVSTGGGTPIFNDLIDLMNSHGESIYLKCSKETLFRRLKNKKKERPLICHLSDKELQRYIEQTLKKREKIYNKGIHIIKNDDDQGYPKEILRRLR